MLRQLWKDTLKRILRKSNTAAVKEGDLSPTSWVYSKQDIDFLVGKNMAYNKPITSPATTASKTSTTLATQQASSYTIVNNGTSTVTIPNPYSAGTYGSMAGATSYNITAGTAGVSGSPYYNSSWSNYGAIPAVNISPSSSTVLKINGKNNKELVTINNDGTVVWADDIKIDEAATALSEALTLSAERAAGVTYGVKQRIRDAVFEELISMANEKKTLTAEDLTFLHQSAKIMDKLRGIK